MKGSDFIKTAKQALEETMNNLTIQSNKELQELSIKIDEAIKNGRYYIFECGELNAHTIYELEKLGYGVKHDRANSTWYYFVSWLCCDVDGYCKSTFCNEEQKYTTQDSNNNAGNERNKYRFPFFHR